MTDHATDPQVVGFPETQVSVLDAYLRGLQSAQTRKVYRRVIRDFGTFLGDRAMVDATRRDVEAFRAHLERAGRAAPTIARALSALSGFFTFAEGEDAVDRNPVASARRPKLPDCSPRRALSLSEIHALLDVPDMTTLAGLRDRALLMCLATQGWRISEALGLRVEDLDHEQGHRVATIYGKGAKVARVALAGGTSAAIDTWLSKAQITSGPMFVGITKGGLVRHGKALSQQAAWRRLQKIATKAGLRRRLHAHLFRHSAVTHALAANVPLHQVQDFVRHADPRTTRRYDSLRQSLNNPTAHVLASLLDKPE